MKAGLVGDELVGGPGKSDTMRIVLIAEEVLADPVIVTRSEHVPRIQEAQASAYHELRELIELEAAQ